MQRGDKMNVAIKAAIALFPDTFGLRGHNGIFRFSAQSSYTSDWSDTGTVFLYTQVYNAASGEWSDFAKGTISELITEVVFPDWRIR